MGHFKKALNYLENDDQNNLESNNIILTYISEKEVRMNSNNWKE